MKAHVLPEMTVKTAIWVINSLLLRDADIFFFLADKKKKKLRLSSKTFTIKPLSSFDTRFIFDQMNETVLESFESLPALKRWNEMLFPFLPFPF